LPKRQHRNVALVSLQLYNGVLLLKGVIGLPDNIPIQQLCCFIMKNEKIALQNKLSFSCLASMWLLLTVELHLLYHLLRAKEVLQHWP